VDNSLARPVVGAEVDVLSVAAHRGVVWNFVSVSPGEIQQSLLCPERGFVHYLVDLDHPFGAPDIVI
jgi:hypothetical protein